MNKGWLELESDPGLFTLLLEEIGVDGVQVEEIYDLQKPMDGEVYGFIFLFRWIEERRSRRKTNTEVESFVTDVETVNNMFFAQQIIPNSCATHALLSVLLNCGNKVKLGKTLTLIKDFTDNMSPEDKGFAIANMPELAKVHNSFARPETSKPVPEKQTGLSSIRATESESFHFVSYVNIAGHLFELDGLKPHPIDHGPCEGGEAWTEKFRRVISDRLGMATGGEPYHDIRFNLMAVVPDKRQLLEHKLNTLKTNRNIVLEALQQVVSPASSDRSEATDTDIAETRKTKSVTFTSDVISSSVSSPSEATSDLSPGTPSAVSDAEAPMSSSSLWATPLDLMPPATSTATSTSSSSSSAHPASILKTSAASSSLSQTTSSASSSSGDVPRLPPSIVISSSVSDTNTDAACSASKSATPTLSLTPVDSKPGDVSQMKLRSKPTLNLAVSSSSSSSVLSDAPTVKSEADDGVDNKAMASSKPASDSKAEVQSIVKQECDGVTDMQIDCKEDIKKEAGEDVSAGKSKPSEAHKSDVTKPLSIETKFTASSSSAAVSPCLASSESTDTASEVGSGFSSPGSLNTSSSCQSSPQFSDGTIGGSEEHRLSQQRDKRKRRASQAFTPKDLLDLLKNVENEIELCETNLREENEKRKKYKIDACRRTHNYDQFIMTFLSMLAEQGFLGDLMEENMGVTNAVKKLGGTAATAPKIAKKSLPKVAEKKKKSKIKKKGKK